MTEQEPQADSPDAKRARQVETASNGSEIPPDEVPCLRGLGVCPASCELNELATALVDKPHLRQPAFEIAQANDSSMLSRPVRQCAQETAEIQTIQAEATGQ